MQVPRDSHTSLKNTETSTGFDKVPSTTITLARVNWFFIKEQEDGYVAWLYWEEKKVFCFYYCTGGKKEKTKDCYNDK